MERLISLDNALTVADRLVLKTLVEDIKEADTGSDQVKTARDIAALKDMRNVPTVFLSVDGCLPLLLQPYIRLAQKAARHPTDVVMITHLLLYLCTTVPSALLLYRHFSLVHGLLHVAMQLYYMGTYTLMMHQHIHQRGILTKNLALIDRIFPYLFDPLMGHTWNSYYYHHVKHHHVENNGPDDLSSTIRYQRDSVPDFARYVGRFFFLVWLELPLYFVRTKRPTMALRAGGWEILTYLFYLAMATRRTKATIFVYLIPFLLMRLGLMLGNWAQHAFVDSEEPNSDFRSSITLIDVASNRFCFNDGYHTSHHLNPLRHWRDHPISFLEQKQTYAREGALVFHNIDFLFISLSLLRKDYDRLARCMVPIGNQMGLDLEGRVALLKRLTRSSDRIRRLRAHSELGSRNKSRKTADVITLFHRPGSAASNRVAELLKRTSIQAQTAAAENKASEREPFELDITEEPPTSGQVETILEYAGPRGIPRVIRDARDQKDAMQRFKESKDNFLRPITVDWDKGKVVTGDNESEILKLVNARKE
ncbi:hypothetical protein L249_4727 [Ophiocordyceps polyrhachis-furcata BCC 54312]|uniref:Fatty acid desaturase domain-containing protein n=1 Tax=Ophiocordyceps polyrhachis-furcata BCC 54312 TaxID=1330021 RepID=A0A367L2T4_9HYPO|nr:hypothetical protein L249_4727 [Ophiocordyceps polyrhachis-furcata BCC 54312]